MNKIPNTEIPVVNLFSTSPLQNIPTAAALRQNNINRFCINCVSENEGYYSASEWCCNNTGTFMDLQEGWCSKFPPKTPKKTIRRHSSPFVAIRR
jgi:hypothetical protein